MKIQLESNIIKSMLQNVYFITGTAYAGKSTMAELLAKRYDMILCGENYHDRLAQQVITPECQPNLCYFQTMSGWKEYVNRTPEEYARWYEESSKEAAELEIAWLLRISGEKKVIVDTNIPLELLSEISDYQHVAVMLSPQSMSVEHFFERPDPEKQFLLQQIQACENPEKTLANFKACIAQVNRKEVYEEFLHSNFYTILRESVGQDTKEEVLEQLAAHFGLKEA